MITGNWHVEHQQSLTPGQRAADALRNGMGRLHTLVQRLSARR